MSDQICLECSRPLSDTRLSEAYETLEELGVKIGKCTGSRQ